jgi:NAD(P)-dependent dehydrogenase (short-subunit alcohol dehydrogenase family)
MAGNRLAGKNALVTGAGVRLGRAMAVALANAGAGVCVHYCHSAAAAEQTVATIREQGGQASAVRADLQQGQTAAHSLMASAHERLGPVDILVNSAAVFEPSLLTTIDDAHFDLHIQLNLKAPLFLSQAFAKQIRDDRSGQIVNIVDWRAFKPPTGHMAYTISKAGLVTLTKILAQELSPRIRVNAIAPGAILPPAGAGADYEQRIIERIPLGRLGRLEEITAALLYLLDNDFVTGEVLCVTGGEELK